MKKKKGFTLIELLAVIIILAIIALIATPIMINIINAAKEASYKRSIELYGKAVEQAIVAAKMDNSNNITKGLYKTGSNRTIIPKVTSEDIQITVNYKGTEVNCDIINVYENGTVYINDCSVDGNEIDYAYGNPLCALEDGESNKYTCNLDKARTFYVLKNDSSSDNISLIMDRNFTDDYVPITLSWCTDGGTNNRTCKNISTTGSEAPIGKDYIGHITEVFNTEGVTVSFPTDYQITEAYTGTPPTWLYGNLNSSGAPDGYWTASPLPNFSNLEWHVNYNGYLSYKPFDGGVRPVITISKSLLN